VLQVKWDDGFAGDTPTFIAAFPELSSAVAKQVAHIWANRQTLGLQAQTISPGGSITLQTEADHWLTASMKTLNLYANKIGALHA
jgi:hypothetical protein